MTSARSSVVDRWFFGQTGIPVMASSAGLTSGNRSMWPAMVGLSRGWKSLVELGTEQPAIKAKNENNNLLLKSQGNISTEG